MLREFERNLELADTEQVPAERARRIVAAIHEFLALAEDRELSAGRARIYAGTDEVARAAPDAAVRLLPRLTGFFGLHHKRAQTTFTAWLGAPEAATFAATWAAAGEILIQSQDLAVWLANTVRAGVGVAPAFPALARNHLIELVEADFRAYEFSGATSPVWMLMTALGPSTRPDWYLLLGDRAAERGDEAEAAHRYELADRFGAGGRARNRLRRLHDLAAYHRVRQGMTAPEEFRSPGTPTPYRHLAMATAATMDGRSPSTSLTEVIRHGDSGLRPLAKFLTALTRVRAGEYEAARTQLRELLEATPDSPDRDEDIALRANMRLVLGVLEEDDELIVAGARALAQRFGAGWPDRSLPPPATVLRAVSRRDPGLPAEFIGSGIHHDAGGRTARLRCDTAREYLAEAARATVFARPPTEAGELLSRAEELLAGASSADADELRATATHIHETAARLRATTAPERPLDRLAYALLRSDGVVRPWTDTTLRLWRDHLAEDRDECDPNSLHHLAVAEHARAYQLEIAGDDGAFESWRHAHTAWARVWADDRFWAGLGSRLRDVAAGTSPEEVARVVAEARGELPAQLLEPHIARVQELRRNQLSGARAHLELIRGAPFAPADIARARGRLAREAGIQIRRLTREGRLDRALHEAQAWIEIDPDNIPLAEQTLDVGIEVAETERDRGTDWAARARPSLERIAALVEPLRTALGLGGRQLDTRGRPRTEDPDRLAFAAKLARHEFWLGAATLLSTADRLDADPYADRTGFRTAAHHFHNALTLGVPTIEPYSRARELLVSAGQWERAAQGGGTIGFF